MTDPSSVMDTAHWTAVYRAIESRRLDALFRDPFAERLAGRAGALPASVPPWPMIVRTAIFDALIEEAVAGGVDLVLNLGAGLDARPYRLPLPASLRWIEADLPRTIDEKNAVLEGETPRCALSRHAVDLSDRAARRRFLDEATAGARSVLVMSEGVLLYLTDAEVIELGGDLLARPNIATWLVDLASPGTLRKLKSQTDTLLAERDRMKFAPSTGVAFYESIGWHVDVVKSLIREGRRLHRLPFFFRLLSLLPPPNPRSPGNIPWGAVVRLTRPK